MIPILLLCTLFFTSCAQKNRIYDPEQVKQALTPLLTESAWLNEVYYGSGIPTEEDGVCAGTYREASGAYLEQHGIGSLSDLKERTRAVFTEEVCRQIFSTRLSSAGGDSGVIFYTRYYQSEGDTAQGGGKLMVDTRATPLLSGTAQYLTDTLRAVRAEGEEIVLCVSVQLSTAQDTQKRTLTFRAVQQQNGWRISSPTYISYNPYENTGK